MTQPFTYFRPDGSSNVRVQPKGPLPQTGEVWVRGRYAPDVQPDPLNVRVGTSGVKVWMVIQWLNSSNQDVATLRRRFGDIVEPEDVEAARWFYGTNRAEIDAKLREEEQAAVG